MVLRRKETITGDRSGYNGRGMLENSFVSRVNCHELMLSGATLAESRSRELKEKPFNK